MPGVDLGQQAGRLLVMLVLDVADDLLDHVLDRQQPLGAAELVDDDGEMDPAGAHPREQIEHAHRFGHVERRAHQLGDVGGRRLRPTTWWAKTSLTWIMPITVSRLPS